MNISGKELKELIPEEALFCLDSIQMLDRDQTNAIVHLAHKSGGMSILVYRKSLGKLLLKTHETAPKTPERAPQRAAVAPAQAPAPALALALALELAPDASPTQAEEPGEGCVYSVGMTRKKDGVTQRLDGFSNSGSLREKPSTAQRRVPHPVTKQMVWPLWVEVKV